MSPIYGFHMNDDRQVRVEAATLAAAIKLAEHQTGAMVLRGQKIGDSQ